MFQMMIFVMSTILDNHRKIVIMKISINELHMISVNGKDFEFRKVLDAAFAKWNDTILHRILNFAEKWIIYDNYKRSAR